MNANDPERLVAEAAAQPANGVLATGDMRRLPALLELSSLLLRIAELSILVGTAVLCSIFLLDHVSPERVSAHTSAVVLAAIFFAIFAELTGVYDIDVRFSARLAWNRLLFAWLAAFLFLITAGFFLKSSSYFSRLWLTGWFASGGIGVIVVRGIAVALLRVARRRGYFNQRVVIFGADAQGVKVARHILGSDRVTIDLLGYYDDRGLGRTGSGLRDLRLHHRGNLKALLRDIREGGIDQVIVALPWSEEDRIRSVVTELSVTPVRVRLAPDLAAYLFPQRPTVMLDNVPLLTLFERPISGTDQILKRAEDLVLASAIFILCLPLLLIVALAVKLDSPGPVLFRQPREGFNNRVFDIYKFRSMYVDRGQVEHIAQARRGDPRVTRLGRILRRTSIDELPQLFNVLRGDMSLVGPRPHAPSTKAGERVFSDVVSTYASRHRVKPGITGWAQVSGWRGETQTPDKLIGRLEHDLYYIENWSVMFDLYILIRTVAATVSARAY